MPKLCVRARAHTRQPRPGSTAAGVRDPAYLEHEHYVAEVGALHFRDGVLLEFVSVCVRGVETEALAGRNATLQASQAATHQARMRQPKTAGYSQRDQHAAAQRRARWA
jgi:hypothetical protein